MTAASGAFQLMAAVDSQPPMGWQRERAELRQEIRLLQEELAETRAQREELASRVRALDERVSARVSGVLAGALTLLLMLILRFSPSPAGAVSVSLAVDRPS